MRDQRPQGAAEHGSLCPRLPAARGLLYPSFVRRPALLFLLFVLAVPTPAHAFVRSTLTSDPNTAIWWRHRGVPVHPWYDPAAGLAIEAQEGALFRSMASWNDAARGCSDMQLLLDSEAVAPDTLGSTDGVADGTVRVVFRTRTWIGDPCVGGNCQAALTITRFDPVTGQIRDADIDVNMVENEFSVSGAPGGTDLESVLTHEFGHLLGFGHVDDPEATMFPRILPGETHFRSLSQDEVDAICTVYPEGVRTPGAAYAPTRGLSGGCSVSASEGASPWWLLLGAFAFWRRSRRRRAG